jgi:hypothetical protein
MMLPGDPDAVSGTKIERQALRRAWVFAQPYKWAIVGFLTSILVSALLALAPPLLFRAILDHSIPQNNKGQITVLAAFLVAAALGDAVLAILQRWYSSRIGEGLIYDLRVALFDKVQQMPIAFSREHKRAHSLADSITMLLVHKPQSPAHWAVWCRMLLYSSPPWPRCLRLNGVSLCCLLLCCQSLLFRRKEWVQNFKPLRVSKWV